MKDFWDIFRSSPRIIGGCIWDFKDQGLLKKDSAGVEFYAYGGDFGEKLHDGNFCINGIVASDGRPKAAIYECKRVYQGAESELVDAAKGLIKITNRHAVKSLSDYAVNLIVRNDGSIISNKTLPRINLAAGRDTVINIAAYLPKLPLVQGASEYLADIHFTLASNEAWAPKGHEVASNQFALSPVSKGVRANKNFPSVLINEDASSYSLSGKGFNVKVDKKNGALSSFVSNGREQISAPLLPHFKRPLTDNDRRGWKPNRKLAQWYEPNLKLREIKSIGNGAGVAQIRSIYTLINDSASVEVTYTLNGNGVLKVDHALNVKQGLPNIPKVGMKGGIARSNDNISWYGRGLYENYVDRRYGFDAAIYAQPIEQFMEPYVMPQENGYRTDVRWMHLSNKSSEGLLVVADSLLSMSAWPYTEENIETAKHTNKLKEAGYITLNIDLMQMGVGGNDTWSDIAAPLDKYQIPAKNYSYSFYLMPYKGAKDGISNIVRRIRF
jgi:beta-galactosidase